MKITRLPVLTASALLFLGSAASLSQDVEWQLSESKVGVGTGSPETKLHVVGDGGNSIEEVFRLQTGGAPQQVFLNSNTGAMWLFAMAGDDSFKVSFAGTGKVEARFRQDGNMIIAGALTENSDRNRKDNIREINGNDVLLRVLDLPISTWEYKADRGVTHLGPMAQDFYAAFGLGQSPTGISTIDTGGVALAAIQGLHAQLEDKTGQIERLEAENQALKAGVQQQDERLLTLEMTLAELMRMSTSDARLSSRN